MPAEINDSVTYDIGDIVSGKIKTLSTHDKFMYLKHHFTPDKKFPYFTQTINSGKGEKMVTLKFQHTWLEQYK